MTVAYQWTKDEYIQSLQKATIRAEMKLNKDRVLDDSEQELFRTHTGQIGWLAVQKDQILHLINVN